MKKIITLFLFISLSLTIAKDCFACCSTSTPQRSFGGFLSSISGFNFLTRNIIELAIQKAIQKETGSKFKIKISNFYATNILSGEFKALSAKSKRFISDDVYLSDINVKTICPYNKITLDNDKIIFSENLALDFNAKMTQDDLQKTIQSGSYKKMIDKLNKDKKVSSLVKITDYDVKLDKDKLIFKYKLTPQNFLYKKLKPISISFGANLRVMDGKVKICNFELNENFSTYGIFLPLVDKLNPTSWQFEIDETNLATLDFKKVQIINSEILLNGTVVIKKTN